MKFGKILLTSLLLSAAAFANVTDSQGTWNGSGIAYDGNGAQAGTFTVSVVNQATSNNQVDSQITVTEQDGTVLKMNDVLVDDGNGAFSQDMDGAKGGGRCFANGICESYVSGSDGHAYATTIVLDGSDQERIFINELQGGKATGFVSEKLARVK